MSPSPGPFKTHSIHCVSLPHALLSHGYFNVLSSPLYWLRPAFFSAAISSTTALIQATITFNMTDYGKANYIGDSRINSTDYVKTNYTGVNTINCTDM